MKTILNTLPQAEPEVDNKSTLYDLIIIGSGPAGMAAAVCAARADLSVLIIDKAMPGGSLTTAFKIANVMGFPDGIIGPDMAKQMESHMMRYPIKYVNAYIDELSYDSDRNCCRVSTHINTQYYGRYSIIATGLEPKKLHRPFESQFRGRGFSYFADCDGSSYQDKPIAVIGGGNCAGYAAEYLSQFAETVYLIHRSDNLRAVALLKQRILANPSIQVMWHSDVIDALGVDRLNSICVKQLQTEQTTWLDVNAVFVYIGRIPNAIISRFGVACDEDGFIITDDYMRTSNPHVYAVGDIRAKQIRQVQTALSDGMTAAVTISQHLAT